MNQKTTPKIAPRFITTFAEVFGLARTPKKQEESIGQRLARLRRDRGITQAELADMLGIAQPMISGYERDTIRLHGEAIVELTRILGVSADELLGLETAAASTPVKNKRLLRKIHELDRLPRRDQEAVIRTINAFLSKSA